MDEVAAVFAVIVAAVDQDSEWRVEADRCAAFEVEVEQLASQVWGA